MERLDFASVMAVLRRNISEDICPNQLDLIEALFRDMGYNPDACMEFDNGLVCRWMNGLAKLSPKITTFYQDNYNQRKEYLCIRDGEERGFTGLEFKSAQKEGWEKQYQWFAAGNYGIDCEFKDNGDIDLLVHYCPARYN